MLDVDFALKFSWKCWTSTLRPFIWNCSVLDDSNLRTSVLTWRMTTNSTWYPIGTSQTSGNSFSIRRNWMSWNRVYSMCAEGRVVLHKSLRVEIRCRVTERSWAPWDKSPEANRYRNDRRTAVRGSLQGREWSKSIDIWSRVLTQSNVAVRVDFVNVRRDSAHPWKDWETFWRATVMTASRFGVFSFGSSVTSRKWVSRHAVLTWHASVNRM